MGQISFRGQIPKYCNLSAIQSGGSKADVVPANGEVWLIDSTNSKSGNGAGEYDFYIVGDGTTACSDLPLREYTFPDKIYKASAFSGLGRKYLRKNIVDVSGTDKNVLTAAMLADTNTVYHIQYDYDLNGQTITVPAGVTLKFEGGSLSNGTIVGTNTRIVADETAIFKDIVISSSGTWNVETLYSRWFDSSDETVYSTIDNLLNMNSESISTNIYIRGDYDYVPSHTYGTQAVKSNTTFYVEGTITHIGAQDSKNLFDFGANAHDIAFYGGTYVGSLKSTDDSTTPDLEYGHCFMFREASNITFDGCTIQNFTGDGIAISSAQAPTNVNQNVVVRNCIIDKVSRNGITIIAGKNIIIENCIIKNITRKSPSAAIDIEPNYSTNPCNEITIRNCRVENCLIGFSLANTNNADFSSISVSNCVVSVENTPLLMTKAKNVLIENSKFTSINLSANSGAFITNCDFVRIINNVFSLTRGITVGGGNIFYSGNTFSFLNSGGFTYAEGVFENNVFECYGALFATGALIQTGHRQNFIFTGNKVKCKSMVFTNTQCMIMENNTISLYDASSVETYFINGSMYDANSRAVIRGNFFDINASTRHIQFWPGCNLDFSNNTVKVTNDKTVIFISSTAAITAKNNSAQGNVFILPERFTSLIYSGINALTSAANKNGDIVFLGSIGKYGIFDGTKWVDANNFTAALGKGTTALRPSDLFGSDNGFPYFDTDLGKPIFLQSTVGSSVITKTNIAQNLVDGVYYGVTASNTLTKDANYKYETTNHTSRFFKASFRKTNKTEYDDPDEILICESNNTNDHVFFKAPDPAVYPYIFYGNRGNVVVTTYIKSVTTEWLDATGAPAANSLKVLKISQTDYDNLGTYDSNTLYVITSA